MHDLIRKATGYHGVCTCGHTAELHNHYSSRALYCSKCGCNRLRRWYRWRDYRPIKRPAEETP